MRRFNLSQRLTVLFILLLMLCATVACAVQLYSSMPSAPQDCHCPSGIARIAP